MLTYIIRRLLLMIPTLVGITLLVFMLLALSPGGIGASLRVAGGQMEASKAALMEAYLEDRYGLDDPKWRQYLRWLHRISPVKFGVQDQVLATGDLVRFPKEIKPVVLESWFADLGPDPDRLEAIDFEYGPRSDREVPRRAKDSIPVSEFKAAQKSYSKARASYLVAGKELDKQLVRYAAAMGWPNTVSDGEPVISRLRVRKPDRSSEDFAPVEVAARAALDARAVAEAARQREVVAFEAGPYPNDGFAIVPGVVSIAAPDLGIAFSRGRPVKDLILEALPVTLLLNLVAVPIIYLVAIPAGMLAARYRGSAFDVSSGAVFVAFWSIPTVWAGVLAIGYLADNQYLGWFPVAGLHANDAAGMTYFPSFSGGFRPGYLLDTLWHLALPVACLVYTGFAVLAKQTRAAMLDNFSQDYVRTAKAKGVPGRDVLLRHVFRNSLLPLITIFVTIFPAMLAGSVVVEKIFSIPGMGSLILEAINLRDRELILANTFMIAVVNLLALLLADILYAFADPRISYD